MTLRQLSGLDAGFLSLETPRSPMLVGGVSILGPNAGGRRLELAALRALLRGRLQRAVALRRKLATVPLDLARPYWVELASEQVDLDAHVERTELPEPGGWRELSALFAWQLGQPLDRSRPLWQITLVEGLSLPEHPPGSVALIGVVHHAAIDGVSGAEILAVLFDGHAEGAPTGAGDASTPAGDEPSALELLAQAGRDLAAGPLQTTAILGRSLLGMAASGWSRTRGAAEAEPPPLPFTAPASPFNRPLVGPLAWAPARLDLRRVKAIKDAAGATVNDVVLAVCAAALRGWLSERGELPAAPLVAMVPVSVRGAGERAQAGNLVSAMLVSLATDVPDARERLLAIRDAARSSKLAHQAVGARTLLESADLLPFALSGLAVRLYSRLQLAERHRPIFNLVITNVPGPPRPLTIGGLPLRAHVGAAPLFDGLALLLTVMSYAGTMTVGITADRAVMPAPAELAIGIESALDELHTAVVA